MVDFRNSHDLGRFCDVARPAKNRSSTIRPSSGSFSSESFQYFIQLEQVELIVAHGQCKSRIERQIILRAATAHPVLDLAWSMRMRRINVAATP